MTTGFTAGQVPSMLLGRMKASAPAQIWMRWAETIFGADRYVSMGFSCTSAAFRLSIVRLLLQKLELLIEGDLCCNRFLLESAELVGPLGDLVVTPLHLQQCLLPQLKLLLTLLVDAAEVLGGLGRSDSATWRQSGGNEWRG